MFPTYCRYIKHFTLTRKLKKQPASWAQNCLLGVLSLVSYLQELSSRITETKFPQHANLDLETDSSTFPTVQCISPLHLLSVPEFLQAFDHLFNNRQTRNFFGGWGGGGGEEKK